MSDITHFIDHATHRTTGTPKNRSIAVGAAAILLLVFLTVIGVHNASIETPSNAIEWHGYSAGSAVTPTPKTLTKF
ncbi:hypothetical protein [Pacificibacter sp.]|uniref:hypothetical protein n=1 Tax=Pacificibacter sp. TaxID=1917866 RepID=UPI00321B2BAC